MTRIITFHVIALKLVVMALKEIYFLKGIQIRRYYMYNKGSLVHFSYQNRKIYLFLFKESEAASRND